jgi:hypothetical protein
MRQFITRRCKKVVHLGAAVIVSIGVWSSAVLGQAKPEQVHSDSLQASEKWKQHETSAQMALDQASECLGKSLEPGSRPCDSVQFLKKAGDEYGELEALLGGTAGHAEEAASIANGFMRCGLPIRAIKLLMNRADTATDPALSHLLADALFAMGDFPNAAKAYAVWIRTGCDGYLYSMQDKHYWLIKLKADPCTYLPKALRTRLELLKETTSGALNNLPEDNDPAPVFPRAR